MKAIALGGRDFISGFQLAGVQGVEVSSPSEALEAIARLMPDKEVGLILLGEDLARQIRNNLNKIRSEQAVPIIYEVPSPGSRAEKIEYRDMLKAILGL